MLYDWPLFLQRPEWGYTGMMDAIVTINRDEGPLAFWKGVEAVFMRNTICMLGIVYGYKEVGATSLRS